MKVCSPCSILIIAPVANRHGVPLGMSRMSPEYLAPESSAADVLFRQEPEDEEEDDEQESEDEGKEESDEGYSE